MNRRSRKETAWRKNRKFGDVHGGRKYPKLTDRIFSRVHSLDRPTRTQATPLLISENPSRDFHFPLNADEVAEAIASLPRADTSGITHIWLRAPRKPRANARGLPLAEYVCGSGVAAVILYPWKNDLRIRCGQLRPTAKTCRTYEPYAGAPFQYRGWWYFEFTPQSLRRFYIEHLIYHEIGHHVDRYQRHWSKSNSKKLEEFADQYAMRMTRTATCVLNRLEKARRAEDEEES